MWQQSHSRYCSCESQYLSSVDVSGTVLSAFPTFLHLIFTIILQSGFESLICFIGEETEAQTNLTRFPLIARGGAGI